jgi:nucleoside-diphosphate-sugar epimerase
MNVLVLGGTGVISRTIVNRLLEKKHSVTIFNRGNRPLSFSEPVRQITGDRQDRVDFESRMRRESFDAVIDMICFNEADARSTIRAFRECTDQIIVCSSVAAYRRPYRSVPTVESAESLYDDPTFAYAYHKAQAERYLDEVIRGQQLPITVIRPSLTYGLGASNIGVLRQNFGIVDRIRKGKPLVMFGDGSTPWSFTFAPDLAKAFVGVLGNSQTYGQAYHACSEQRCRWEDLYLEFGKVLGIEPHIVHIPSELLRIADPELFSHLYLEKTFVGLFDNSKIRGAVPDFSCDISLHDGLKMMVEWFEQEANQVDPEKDAMEDRLVELYAGWASQMQAFSADN